MCRGIDNQRVALRPIRTIDCVEPHPAIPDMDLQPIAVMLQLVRPARSTWRLLGDDWLARMNESKQARLMACRERYAIPGALI
jgi:hypothetical protein